MGKPVRLHTVKQFLLPVIVIAVTLLASATLLQAQGNPLQNRSVKLSNSQASAQARYSFSFKPVGLDTIQSVELEICSNDPFPGTPCTSPNGFDASDATLLDQSGDTGFSIASAESTANRIVLTRPPLASNAQQNTYEFDDIVNPDAVGSYYVRLLTFADSDIHGDPTNYGGLAFAINYSVSVKVTVPPYLLFCAAVTVNGYNCENTVGNYIDFGEFSSRQASLGSTQMLAATNAKDGYNIRVTGTTLTSGNNIISSLVGSDVSRPGVSQFGMNLRANSSPQGGLDASGAGNGLPTNGYNQINFYRFNEGDIIAGSAAPDNARKYTSAYVVNVSKSQSPGVYVSTVTYIALGNF